MAGRFREWSLDCKVYIGNLPEGASKTEIEALFNKYGPLKNVWVARNPPGFAFVEFEDPRDAEDAVRALDGSRVAGSRVRVEMSHGRSRRERGGGPGGPRGPPRRGGPPPPRYDDRYGMRGDDRRRYRSRSRSRSRSPRRYNRGRYSRSRSYSRSPSPKPRAPFSRSPSPMPLRR